MKKTVKITAVILAVIIVIVALLSRNDRFVAGIKNLVISSSSEPEKVLDFYADAVENTVNTKDFKLNVTTTVNLNKIDCSISILNGALKNLLDYRLGRLDDEVRSYTFIDGVSADNSSVSPKDVIQLTCSDVDKRYYNGIEAAQLEDFDDYKSIAFIIKRETATVEAVMRAVNYLNQYGKMSDSPEVKALAPVHTNFIDITSVVRSIQDMVQKNNSSAGIDKDKEQDIVGENGATSEIDGGICSLGNTNIMCDVNSDLCLKSVMIYAPVNIQANIKFLNRDIEADIQVDIFLNYTFSYDI